MERCLISQRGLGVISSLSVANIDFIYYSLLVCVVGIVFILYVYFCTTFIINK